MGADEFHLIVVADLDEVLRAVAAGQVIRPSTGYNAPHVLDGDYAPRSAVEIFVKDLGIVQDMARSARFPVPVAAAALQMFLMTAACGMGRDDDASVARMYAQIGGAHLPGEPK